MEGNMYMRGMRLGFYKRVNIPNMCVYQLETDNEFCS